LFACFDTTQLKSLTVYMINSIASKPAALLVALERLLPSVQKPAIFGHEINAVTRTPPRSKFVGLAFLMLTKWECRLGLKILYSIINEQPDFYAERAFAPWPDMEAVMRETTPL
jgi:hypothetical protein